MLRSTEAPVCRQIPTPQRSAAHVRDIRKTASGTVTPVGGYPLLVFQARSHEAATRQLKNIKKDLASLGKVLKGSAVQAMFSSVPLAGPGDWAARGELTSCMTDCMSGVMPKAMASMQESWTRWLSEEKRITESQNCRSWKGPLKIIKSTVAGLVSYLYW